MKINTSKCKVISSDKRNITINGEAIETVDKFTFLGSSVPAVADDVQRRINLAAWAFGRLRDKIWSNQNISRTIKVRIYKALILPIATYGSESWTLRRWTKTNLKCLKCDVLGPLLELNCVTESGMLTSDENFISTRPLPKKSTNGN